MSVKEQVLQLAQQLPEEVTWEDVAYEVYVRQSIESGLADVAAGHTIPVEEAKEYLRNRLESRRARSLDQ